MHDRWRRELRGLYSALLFALGIYLLFQNWGIAWLFTLSLGLHELGHVLAAWRLGLDWEMGFGLLGAWTRTPLEQRRALGQFANSLIHLTGPLVSLALAVAALGIHLLSHGPALRDPWLTIANFNAILCVLNLLPLGRLSDGGKLAHRLFISAGKRFEWTVLAVAGAVPLVGVWILLYIRLDWERIVALLAVVVWFTISLLVESREDEAAEPPPAPMARRQIGILSSILTASFILSLAIALLTPFWLTRTEALKMAIDFTSIAIYILWAGPPVLRAAVGLALFLAVYLVTTAIVRRLGWQRARPLLLDRGNRLFSLARSGRRLPGWMLALTMSEVFLLLGSIPAAVVVAYLALKNPAFSPSLPLEQMIRVFIGSLPAQVTLLILGFAPVSLLVWAWVAWYEHRPFRTLGFERGRAVARLLRGALLGGVAYSGVVILLLLSGAVRAVPRALSPTGLVASAWAVLLPVLMILAWAVQGSTEEILFRGWLLPVLGARYGPWVGIVLSAASFALVHGLNLGVSWLAVANLLLIALFLSFYALWEGGLWGVCGFHLAWNWAEGNLFGLEISGIPPAGGTLFHLAPVGLPVITGGGFGPEGGLAVTVVILVAIAGLVAVALARAAHSGGRDDGVAA